MEFPLVTILIITWNRKKDILEAVKSIYEQANQNFEIIVVDNGSNDGTVGTLRHAYPDVKIVSLDRNMGVSVGRNAGIAIAQGDIIFCLDSDASLGCDTLNNLVRKFQAEPRVGVINSKIVNAYVRYPTDSRVQREAEAPIERGKTVDVICLGERGALNPEYKSGYGFDNGTIYFYGAPSLVSRADLGSLELYIVLASNQLLLSLVFKDHESFY
jgi:GT2 family glycosyltransferase